MVELDFSPHSSDSLSNGKFHSTLGREGVGCYPLVPFSSKMMTDCEVNFPVNKIFLYEVCFTPKISELSAVLASLESVGDTCGTVEDCVYGCT